MKKIIFALICFTTLIVSDFTIAADYKVSLMGTESMTGKQWTVSGINIKGQVYGSFTENIQNNYTKSKLYIADTKGGFKIIEENDQKNNFYSSLWNNNGIIVGSWNGPSKNFMWSKALGFRSLELDEFFKSTLTEKDSNNHATLIAINDLGQLIGNYFTFSRGYRPFLWDNGVMTEMGTGTEFAKQFEELGYNVTDIQLTDINNKGELVGFFQYGKYNEKKKIYVPVGYKTFFWNGSPHILPLLSEAVQPAVVKLNYKGVVLVRDRAIYRETDQEVETTYLWDIEHGIQILPDFYGNMLNDSSIVLGYIRHYSSFNGRFDRFDIPAIWKEGCCSTLAELLGVSNLLNMAAPYSDSYEIERIDQIISINNKGQIVCLGYLWGESHPCILEPFD